MAPRLSPFTAWILCYAILSYPYVCLALVLPGGKRSTQDSTTKDSTATFNQITAPMHVNSTNVEYNIPPSERKTWYFRQGVLVGTSMDDFDIEKYDQHHGLTHLDERALGANVSIDAISFNLQTVGAGILAGAGLVAACAVISPSCAYYIGSSFRAFMAGVQGVPISQAGQAAVQVVANAAGSAPAALPGAARVGNASHVEKSFHRRDYTLVEEFGCYYENSQPAFCEDDSTIASAMTTVVNHDGYSNPPIWSCYEATSPSGTILGYLTHCFADAENCDLTCGSAGPADTAPVHQIAEP